MNEPLFDILEARLSDTRGVHVPSGNEPEKYFKDLADGIKRHRCEPFMVHALVTPPGFPDAEVGDPIEGWCLAHNAGYWLVYQPEWDRFCCFWGTDTDHLGAPGIFGSPLYCWSA